MDLLCVGDVMLDVHARSGELARGGDVHGQVSVRVGGTSANAAAWAAWSGATSGVIGAVGRDLPADLARRALEDRGVDVSMVRAYQAPTGVMLVMTEADERSMVADRGANALLGVEDLPPVLEAGAVLISGYLLLQEPGHAVAIEALARARTDLLAVEAASWPIVERFGADRFLAETSEATAVLANEREAEILTGRSDGEAVRALGSRYRLAVVKRGPAGALVCRDGTIVQGRPDAVEQGDPTGAGDAFDGVLLGSLARGAPLEEALETACRAGALVVAGPEMWPAPGDRAR
ncbi:MAG TPA: PfkB family carbohydrate kinase [Actinomycetota bacterium]